MIERMVHYYHASCDTCHASHPSISDKHLLKVILIRDGWGVTGDNVTCPDCIATKEVEE